MSNRRGVTLIEMLIVVALIAILSAALFSVVTGPLQEWKMADVQSELESGVGMAVCKLVEDAADSTEFSYSEDSQQIALEVDQTQIVYFIDGEKSLRRLVGEVDPKVSAQGALLVPNVETFSLGELDGESRYELQLTASKMLFQQKFTAGRTVEFTVGRPWLEVKR